MRILLDECAPRPLRDFFPQHEILTVPEMGWAGKRNGELLSLMAQNNFDVLLTTDRNLRYQQNLAIHKITIVVMLAVSNRLNDLVPLVPEVEKALENLQAGVVVEIGA